MNLGNLSSQIKLAKNYSFNSPFYVRRGFRLSNNRFGFRYNSKPSKIKTYSLGSNVLKKIKIPKFKI